MHGERRGWRRAPETTTPRARGPYRTQILLPRSEISTSKSLLIKCRFRSPEYFRGFHSRTYQKKLAFRQHQFLPALFQVCRIQGSYPYGRSGVEDDVAVAIINFYIQVAPREEFDGLPPGYEGLKLCIELCVLSTQYACRVSSICVITTILP